MIYNPAEEALMTSFLLRIPRLAIGVALLTLVAAAGCAGAQPAATPASDDGPVKPKVNRLVVAIPALAVEKNNPSRGVQGANSIQNRPIYEHLMSVNPETGKSEPPSLSWPPSGGWSPTAGPTGSNCARASRSTTVGVR